MNIINQNILDIKSGVVAHCVNAQGVFGSGLALQIKNTWPVVYEEYRNKLLWPRYKNLGRAQVVQVLDGLYCANIFSQFDYGTDYRRTEYGSLYTGLKNFKNKLSEAELPVYFPWLLASGRGGADWNLVQEMLDELFPECYICKID